MTVILEQPEEPRGEPIVVVPIHRDGRVGVRSVSREQLLELFLGDEVAHRVLLQILSPVDADGAIDVSLVIGRRIDVDLEYTNVVVPGVLGKPLRVGEGFWVGVTGH